MKHYDEKGCTPVFKDNCPNCPSRFECEKPKAEESEPPPLSKDVCVHKGKTYSIGEVVPMANPCRMCRCGYSYTPAFHRGITRELFTMIHCISIECPETFGVHPYPIAGLEVDFDRMKNCYYSYEKGKCCGKSVCPTSLEAKNASSCDYKGRNYKLGQKIYPQEDACKVCICNEDWDEENPTASSGCYEVRCNLEMRRELKQGCVPIYHEASCCPIDYHCPEVALNHRVDMHERCLFPPAIGNCFGYFPRYFYNSVKAQCEQFIYGGCRGNANNFATLAECEAACQPKKIDTEANDQESCTFNGVSYPIGAALNSGQICVNCTCVVPPDFTCVHHSCPSPDGDHCRAIYEPNVCCPRYDCLSAKITKFNPESCATPICDKNCQLKESENECPQCVCPEIKDENKDVNAETDSDKVTSESDGSGLEEEIPMK